MSVLDAAPPPPGTDDDGGTEAILRAAAALSRSHGEAFTMAQLERRTGLSRATLYRRVGSKKAVLAQLAARGERLPDRGDPHTRILAAARRVVAERGVAGTTIERVADRAGVGVATVYRHFGGREGLLEAFVRAAADRARVQDRVERSSGDLTTDLTAIAREALTLFGDNRDLMRIVLAGTPDELEVLHVLKGPSERTLDRLATLFEREAEAGRLARTGPPRHLALAFVGTLLAFAVIGPDHYDMAMDDRDALARLAVHLFLDGAAS
jgi:AcrR family transcriptional regulator